MAEYRVDPTVQQRGSARVEEWSSASGVSWGAIFAGAAGAAALSLVLLLLGTGLGLSTVSPWANKGASATTIGVASVVWLSIVQLAASGMGGYLAGRLRTKWAGLHTDEVYFRDTAHGFLAWAVATLLTAALLTSAVGSIVGTGAQVGATAAGGAATAAASATAARAAESSTGDSSSSSNSSSGPVGYFVDSLFRRDPSAAGALPSDSSAGNAPASEVARIFVNSFRAGTLSPEDTKYVGQLVAQRTGLSQQDAERRVTDTYNKAQATLNDAKTKAQEAADAARKASAYASLWLVVSMLIGAFVASFAAIYGGRRRDL